MKRFRKYLVMFLIISLAVIAANTRLFWTNRIVGITFNQQPTIVLFRQYGYYCLGYYNTADRRKWKLCELALAANSRELNFQYTDRKGKIRVKQLWEVKR